MIVTPPVAELGGFKHLLRATLAGSLKLRREGRLLVACCPFHGEKTPSFYVYEDHYHCFGCGAHGDAFDWLRHRHGMGLREALQHLSGTGRPLVTPPPSPASDREEVRESAQAVELARRLWCEAVDARGTLVEAYLRVRGVALPDQPVVRFHPRCPRGSERLPAMIARMDDPLTGEPRGVHRTYIRPDGQGKVETGKAKMMLGVAGVIRLDEAEVEGLGVCEGVETALSIIQLLQWRPVWAAGSRGGIQNFPVLRYRCLTIFADGDTPGQEAARACAQRWMETGQEVAVHTPPDGLDWNDAARRLAA